MNPVQAEALARQVLPIVGSVLAVLGMKSATANAIVDMLMAIIGPLMTIASVVWMFFANRNSEVISKAANMPEVQSIKLESSASADVVQSTPTNVTK